MSGSNSLFLVVVILTAITIICAGAVIDEAKLIFFYGDSRDVNKTYNLSEASEILHHPKYNSTHKTVLYSHGYTESPASDTVQLIVNAYIKRGTYNIFILDWSSLVNGTYLTAVQNSNELAPQIAKALLELFSNGMKIENLHLVGHSLGAQLSGNIGKSVIEISLNTIKLHRISGLDPAFVLFYPPSNGTTHISKDDAILVDIIHTDAGKYGAPLNTSCVDFSVNGGIRIQPGCPVADFEELTPSDLCSHSISVAFWAESVSNPLSTFWATNSDSQSKKIQMGINCPIESEPGIYTIETNPESPYAKS